MVRIILLNVVLAGAMLAGCATPDAADPLAGKRLNPPPADHVSILTHPDRPVADLTEDKLRKPTEVLTFTGIEYGMTVVELEAGRGYYTELFAHTVGPEGKVYMTIRSPLTPSSGTRLLSVSMTVSTMCKRCVRILMKSRWPMAARIW